MRNINNRDRILIDPRMRAIPETYEPEVWAKVMSEFKPGDTFVDIGAYMGLYSIAASRHVQPGGKVFAFEPNPASFGTLNTHIKLNSASAVVAVNAAVGEKPGTAWFTKGQASENHLMQEPGAFVEQVRLVSLDTFFHSQTVDILKIDVEGFEEGVLKGGLQLLRSKNCPRVIYIEVHPFNWALSGTTSESLLKTLEDCDYDVLDLSSKRVRLISEYGEIIARKRGCN